MDHSRRPAHHEHAVLLERDGELGLLYAGADAAGSGAGCTVLIEGPAGIGKSSLVGALCRETRDRGLLVLTAQGAELEQEFPYGVVRQLFDALRRSDVLVPEMLEEQAALGAAVAGLRPARDDAAHDGGASALHSLYRLVSNVAERSPLLLAVDDCQWGDAPSLAFVEHLSRRVGHLPVLLAVAVRTPDLRASERQQVFDRMAGGEGVRVVRPVPLSQDATATLVHRDLRDAEPAFVTSCHEASGGNPFLLEHLLREIRTAGIVPVATQSEAVRRAAPDEVRRAVLLRIESCGAAAARLARATAALERNVRVADAAELAGLDVSAAGAAADALAAAGVLTDGRPLAFVHPLLRQAVYAALPAGERSRLHRDAARLSAAAGDSSDHVAAHLLATDPSGDRWTIDQLRSAAAAAMDAGAPDAAATYLRRALEEPPAADLRGTLLAELGMAEAHATDPRCMATLEAALDGGVDAGLRAEIALTLARTSWYLRGDAVTAVRVLEAIDLDRLDDDVRLRIESQRVELEIGWVDGLGGIAPDQRADAIATLERLATRAYPPRPASAVLLGSLARTALERGQPADVAAETALAAQAAGEESLLYSSLPDVLIWSERWADARRILDEVIDAGRRLGSPYMFGVASLWRGVLRYRTGDLVDAEADCLACVQIMDELGASGLTYPKAFLADVLVERDLEQAESLLDGVPPDPAGGHSEFFLATRGRLALRQGRIDDAVRDLRAAGERASFQVQPVDPAVAIGPGAGPPPPRGGRRGAGPGR